MAKGSSVAADLVEFLNSSPTAFHAVDEAKKRLRSAGYEQVSEREDWSLEAGKKCFFTRNHSTIVAFPIGKSRQPPSSGFHLSVSQVSNLITAADRCSPQPPECESPKPEKKTPESEKLYKWVDQFIKPDQSDMPNQWDNTESHPGQKFYITLDNGPNVLLDKITIMYEEDDEDFCTMPPVKYIDKEGNPVYYFANPVTSHKYWDECDCDGCYEDYLYENEGISPHQLKEQHAWEKQQEEEAKARKGNQTVGEASSPSSPVTPTHPIL